MTDSPIKIIGVGGAGCGTVEAVMSSDCAKDCELLGVNTDAASLLRSSLKTKLLLGRNVTKGRSTGNDMKLGEAAAIEEKEKLKAMLAGAKAVFVVAGIGGGTGAGASPVIASIARENKSLVIAFVTVPFKAEGKACGENAAEAISKLKSNADLIVLVQSDRVLELTHSMPMAEAFSKINEVRLECIESMVQVMTQSGLEEVRPMLKGFATIGVGYGLTVREASENSLKHLMITQGVLNVSGLILNVLIPHRFFSGSVVDAVDHMSRQLPDAKIIWVSGMKESLISKAEVIALSIGVSFAL